MTKKEYEKVLDIIEKNMTILRDSQTLFPRIVLTQLGLSNAKKELKELIKEND